MKCKSVPRSFLVLDLAGELRFNGKVSPRSGVRGGASLAGEAVGCAGRLELGLLLCSCYLCGRLFLPEERDRLGGRFPLATSHSSLCSIQGMRNADQRLVVGEDVDDVGRPTDFLC
jgi:hypothetical protein